MYLQTSSSGPGRPRRDSRGAPRVLLALLLLVSTVGIAGGTSSAGAHTSDSPTPSLTVVGHEDFDFVDGPGGNTDVWVLNDFAYVGTFGTPAGCANGTGVKIIDISAPENPTLVGTIPKPDTQVNDIKVIRTDTPFFQGDLLAHSNEGVCPDSRSNSARRTRGAPRESRRAGGPPLA